MRASLHAVPTHGGWAESAAQGQVRDGTERGPSVMRLLYAIVFSACLLLAAPNLVSAQTQLPVDEPADEAFAAVKGWADAINSDKDDHQKVDDIVSRYAPEMRSRGYIIPLFLVTKSPKLATTKKEIRDYFEHFVKEEKPTVVLCKEHEPIAVSAIAVLFAGFYDFTLKQVRVPARYSFLMLKLGDRWLIAHHHSSVRPEGDATCTPPPYL
jgi:hypothetical protein